jgi:hypothetical protein
MILLLLVYFNNVEYLEYYKAQVAPDLQWFTFFDIRMVWKWN